MNNESKNRATGTGHRDETMRNTTQRMKCEDKTTRATIKRADLRYTPTKSGKRKLTAQRKGRGK